MITEICVFPSKVLSRHIFYVKLNGNFSVNPIKSRSFSPASASSCLPYCMQLHVLLYTKSPNDPGKKTVCISLKYTFLYTGAIIPSRVHLIIQSTMCYHEQLLNVMEKTVALSCKPRNTLKQLCHRTTHLRT